MGDGRSWVTHPWVAEARQGVRFGLYTGLGPDWSRNVAWVQTAEEVGFDSFWGVDHPFRHGYDCWTALAGLAGVTKSIRLGSLVTSVPYRSPSLLARIVADVDRQSGGRVVLGLGIGDDEEEFRQLGLPYPDLRTRQAMLGESLQILRGLWGETPFAFQGQQFQIADALVRPGPLQQPRIPLLIAGGGERITLRQVAQYADASNFGAGTVVGNAWTTDDVRRKYATLLQHCEKIGRPADSVLRTYYSLVLSLVERGESQVRRGSTAIGTYDIFEGTSAALVDHYRVLVDAGVQYFIVYLGTDVATLRLFGDEVMSRLNSRRGL
jgi:alkanesulfonate monooxygenase SsuD/methylene tetrahydromethanopterin reductase-like flavin-dependent oxidoreductase (luciferase family)